MRLLAIFALFLIWLVNLQLLTATGLFVGQQIVPTGQGSAIGGAANPLPSNQRVCRYFTGRGIFVVVTDLRGDNSMDDSICPWFLDLRRPGR